jgi:hypothetical protein
VHDVAVKLAVTALVAQQRTRLARGNGAALAGDAARMPAQGTHHVVELVTRLPPAGLDGRRRFVGEDMRSKLLRDMTRVLRVLRGCYAVLQAQKEYLHILNEYSLAT